MIYPDQLVVYDVIRGHRRGINCLCFHSSEPRLLFSKKKAVSDFKDTAAYLREKKSVKKIV